MLNKVLGKVCVTPKGAWDGSIAYDILDIVSYGGGAYVSKQNVPIGTAITDAGYWVKIADKGDKGDTGNQGATGNGIASTVLNNDYTLTITYTDGTSYTTPSIRGATGEVTNASLAQTLLDYAKTDGSYESMTVGNAEQLVSTVGVTDSVPYLFRTSGGNNDIGDREVDKLVGGTVAWNQQFNPRDNGSFDVNGVTITVADGKFTMSGTAISSGGRTLKWNKDTIQMVANHKYYVIVPIDLIWNDTGHTYLTAQPIGEMIRTWSLATQETYLGCNVVSGTAYTNSGYIMVIDLTQMFGTTIADYLYTLETNNAGDGVAWFKKLFPKPYYASSNQWTNTGVRAEFDADFEINSSGYLVMKIGG